MALRDKPIPTHAMIISYIANRVSNNRGAPFIFTAQKRLSVIVGQAAEPQAAS